MPRFWFVLLAIGLFSQQGCRSQCGYPGYGGRVPPPGTGSYGVPNSYYPAATPRTSAVPSNVAPRATNPAVGTWRSVSEGTSNSVTTNAAEQPPEITDSQAVTTQSAVATARPTTNTAPRLRAMPVNEPKRPVSQASFVEPNGT